MKIAQNNQKVGSRYIPPPIPLRRPDIDENNKRDSLVMKLRSDPTDPNSQTYELTVKLFRTGSPETWLLFIKDVKRILIGQNILQIAGKFSMVHQLLLGDALAVFNQGAQEHGEDTCQG